MNIHAPDHRPAGLLARAARAFAGALLVVFVFLPASAAGAATAIAQPKGSPYVVPLDAQGKPASFTVVATGFPTGSLVWIEQCDGRPTTAPNWLPTRDCDLGTAPAAAIADASGTARFPAGDPNHGFTPFVGLGPQGLFNCLTPNGASPKNGLPEYRTCQIRVSSNNNATTTDQVLLTISFAGGGSQANTPARPSAKSSSNTVLFVVIGAVVVAIAGAGAVGLVSRARRAR